ncbi:girdin-like [Hypanus sabinus]|uniref:girdin-like n=1 Tax=Hypanus sabinus TaxID=79690 RepID=UPI0028C48553|nr:girdin-like [Hypanus sabinus]
MEERERGPNEAWPHGALPSIHGPADTPRNLTVQLADSRAKLRRLRQELEERGEKLHDCKQELQELQAEFKALQKQNRELVLEARMAQSYRDEVDVLREKASRVDRLQNEVKAYKERLNSIEFYRGKAEEEREYNQALLETKALLEEQLEAARARCDKLHQVEMENLMLRSALRDLETERENDRQRIEELLDVNLSLKAELNERLDKATETMWTARPLSEELTHGEGTARPLSEEVGEAASRQLAQLERENQELRRRHEELRQSCRAAEVSSGARTAGLEQERQQLQAALARLRSQLDSEKENVRDAELHNSELLAEKSRLEERLQTLREDRDREVQELKLEITRLASPTALQRQRPQPASEAAPGGLPQEQSGPPQPTPAQRPSRLEPEDMGEKTRPGLTEDPSQGLELRKAEAAPEGRQEPQGEEGRRLRWAPEGEGPRDPGGIPEGPKKEEEGGRQLPKVPEEVMRGGRGAQKGLENQDCSKAPEGGQILEKESHRQCMDEEEEEEEDPGLQKLPKEETRDHGEALKEVAVGENQDPESHCGLKEEEDPGLQKLPKEETRDHGEALKEVAVVENQDPESHCGFEEARLALEAERAELAREREQLRKKAGSLRASLARSQELESACQALRAEARRQARALERAEGRVSELEREAEAAEAEVQRRQREAEEGWAAARHLEQEKEALGEASAQAEKERRQLEKEARRLRQQASVLEASLDEQNARILRLEQENRRLVAEAGRVGELLGSLAELEAESTGLARRLATEQGQLASVREELLNEKLKTQQLSNQLESLSHKLQRLRPNPEQAVTTVPADQLSKFDQLELRLDSVLRESLQMKDTHIERLRAQLESAEQGNAALSEQLRELKESLERPQPEGNAAEQSSGPGSEAEDSQRERRDSAQDPVSARLIEVERKNATLLAERGSLSGRARQLESQVEGLQAQTLTLQNHCISLQEQVGSLQAHNTRLQVENTSLGSRNEALVAEGAQHRARQALLEGEAKALGQDHAEVRGQLEALTRDHARLAVLHERQGAELEALVKKHGALKGSCKALEVEHKELEARYNQLLAEKEHLEQLEASLRSQQEALELEAGKQQGLSLAHQQLKDDYNRLNQLHGDGVRQWEELLAEHTAVKGQLSGLQLEKARADVEHAALREQFQQLDVRWTKLSSHCELLGELKSNLEEENRQLIQQVKALADDNRTLLERTVESRDQFHEEQREYADKLNKLRREKQKLVEKIMDQYRVVEPTMPRSKKGNWIADKMKKLIRPRKELTKDQLRPYFITPSGGPDGAEGIVHLSQLENSGLLDETDQPAGAVDGRGPPPKGWDGEGGAPGPPEKILVRTRRKLSSRIYGADTPRNRFRQRRVGWEEEEAETSSTASRDSDPTLDSKEIAKNLEQARRAAARAGGAPRQHGRWVSFV